MDRATQGKTPIDVSRDKATVELFNDVLQGRPSVKTLAMREAAEDAEAAEIADEVRTPNTSHAQEFEICARRKHAQIQRSHPTISRIRACNSERSSAGR